MYTNKEVDANGDPHLSMECIAQKTNMRANMAFAGEAMYTDWSGPFTIKEIRQHIGLYVLNGLGPLPGLERKFNPEDAANYNPFVSSNFGSNAVNQLQQFKAFMMLQDPLKAVPNQQASPLFKVLSMIKWIRRLGPLSWECGIDLGLDKQTIGFQGHHVNKLWINYKKEGDGFHCDALCDAGFTFSVFFRNKLPPAHYTRAGYSPLHARSLWLFDRLQDKLHHCWVDNLYMSAKFAKAAFNGRNKVMTAGVTRTVDRGVPQCVIQDVVDKKIVTTTRGTINAAVLEGDKDCPQLVSMSIYDTKPVHFISLVAESVQWVKKQRCVWNKVNNRMEMITLLQVNVNNDYNFKMNAVDIADQLRNNYRMDHWLQQRKWWWSIFIWGVGVLLTNSYVVYRGVMEINNIPVGQRLTHYL